MEEIKLAIFRACVVGICSSVIMYLCGEKYAPQMRLITAMVLILTIGTPFTGSGFRPELNMHSPDTEYIERSARIDFLREVEENTAFRLSALLKERGLSFTNLSIACTFDEYNYINVSEIRAAVSDNNEKDKLITAIKEYFPDASINIQTQGDKQESESSSDKEQAQGNTLGQQ